MTQRKSLFGEGERFYLEQHQKEREALFANEAFAIGMLQAVSGGALVAGLSQTQSLTAVVGVHALVGFINLSGIALLCSLAAAYLRHSYKMWDVKSRAAEDKDSRTVRGRRAVRHLVWMRWCMAAAMALLSAAIVFLMLAVWWNAPINLGGMSR